MEDTLRQVVKKIAREELEKFRNEENLSMYKVFVSDMEGGLLPVVMEKTRGNQSKAAKWLGINRGTFRKKWNTIVMC